MILRVVVAKYISLKNPDHKSEKDESCNNWRFGSF